MAYPEILRVAYFAGSLRPGQDGVTRVLYRLIDELKRKDIPHIFFSPSLPPPEERSTAMHEVPSVAFPLYPEYRLAVPGSKHFEERLKAFRPDILHINSPCPLGLAAVHFGQRHGIPVVATYHTHFPSYAKYYGIPALEPVGWGYLRGLYNSCARMYVPSQPMLHELAQRGFRQLVCLPHGVDTKMFSPACRSLGWKAGIGCAGKTVLVYVGRLVWEKDLRTLVDLYSRVVANRPDTALVLAGDGPIREELQRAMPTAVFLGHLSVDDLSTAYASSDLLVFPSTTETFGNVMLEGMASGLPAVCAAAGGAHGVVQDGITGLHAAPHDPADFSRAVMELLDHPGRRAAMSDCALAFARTQGWELIMGSLFRSYVEVVHEARRPRSGRNAA